MSVGRSSEDGCTALGLSGPQEEDRASPLRPKPDEQELQWEELIQHQRLQFIYTTMLCKTIWSKVIPFSVRVTGGLVLQSADVTAAGTLDGFSHGVPGLTARTPRHP